MASFPALQPSTRVWIPGRSPLTVLDSISGYQTRISHGSNQSGDTLVLTFANRDETDSLLITQHYANQSGTRDAFSLPAAVFAGLDDYSQLIANGNLWIYAVAPRVEHLSRGIHTITIELRQVLQ
jgi:hypothetical protein